MRKPVEQWIDIEKHIAEILDNALTDYEVDRSKLQDNIVILAESTFWGKVNFSCILKAFGNKYYCYWQKGVKVKRI